MLLWATRRSVLTTATSWAALRWRSEMPITFSTTVRWFLRTASRRLETCSTFQALIRRASCTMSRAARRLRAATFATSNRAFTSTRARVPNSRSLVSTAANTRQRCIFAFIRTTEWVRPWRRAPATLSLWLDEGRHKLKVRWQRGRGCTGVPKARTRSVGACATASCEDH